MEVSTKVTNILSALKELYPDALCALHFGKDYELMIAVRLSAQCTDARVNLVTPALLFLPLGTQIEVKLGQKTTGSQTIIGTFK